MKRASRLLALIVLSSAVGACASARTGRVPLPPQSPPSDFVEMKVLRVLMSPMGNLVVLHDAGDTVHIPIGIGDSEALIIHLRLERRRFERPLTHDLLDRVIAELGGQVARVQVDGLKSGTFVARVFLWVDGHEVGIDARSSDSIAVALGHDAPIYVARSVLDEAGVPPPPDFDAPREKRLEILPPALPASKRPTKGI